MDLPRERASQIVLGTDPYRDVPVFQRMRCTTCGTDHGVAVRYRDGILCLNCYRSATREERERRRRRRQWARRVFAADRGSAVARLWAQLIVAVTGLSREPSRELSLLRPGSTGEIRGAERRGLPKQVGI
jgi:hypothetical protein